MQHLGALTVLRDEQVTIHSYQSPPDGEMVSSQIIELPHSVVVVDVQLLRPYAHFVRKYVDRLNKPIDRVIISHAHADHWFGLEYFADAPIYALAETKATIAAIGEMFVQYKRAELGDLVTEHAITPTHVLNEGKEIIDGVEFVFTKVVDSESPFNLIAELPAQKTLIAQDLVYNNIYLCVGEQNSQGQFLFDGWINALRRLQEHDYQIVLAGHGEPTDMQMITANIAYVQAAKQLFETVPDEHELKQQLRARFPTLRLPEMLDFSNVFLYHRTW